MTLHWDSPRWQEDWLALLADIFGAALGMSVALTIIVELGGRMVLLIPEAVRKLKAEGRKEHRKRLEEAYRRFGVELDGRLMLPKSPEVDAFLDGEE